jgi:hypothetical protein
MKRVLSCAGLAVALAFPISMLSQNVQNPPPDVHTYNHGEIGVYGDMFRVNPPGAASVNFLGLGGRVGFNMGAHAALEGEMNYDFEKNWTSVSVGNGGGGGTSTTITSNVRPISGLFGPKFQFGTSGPVRAFVEGKAGFIDFSTSCNAPAGSAPCFSNSLQGFGGASTHFAAFPGGGIEFFLGPIGLRADAGDEIWLNNGAYNNLRVTFGPTFRF